MSPWARIAIVAGIVLRIVFVIATPVGGESGRHRLSSYNDEIAHAGYIQYVITHRALPGQVESIQESGALARGHFENYQPPLYYAICAAIGIAGGATGREASVMIGRWVALVFSLCMLLVWFSTAQTFNLTPAAASAGSAFVALSGVLVRFGSTASNDTLSWLLLGGAALILIRIVRSGWTIRRGAALSLIFVLGLWTKASLLIALPLPFLTLIRYRDRVSRRHAIGFAVVTLALTSPVWWRNISEFGALVPLSSGFGTAQWRIPDLDSLAYVLRSFVFPWHEFWQGWMGLLLMIPALAWPLQVMITRRDYLRGTLRDSLLPWLAGLTLAAFVLLNLRYDQAEARYLFMAWPWLVVVHSMTRMHGAVQTGVMLLPYCLFLLPGVEG